MKRGPDILNDESNSKKPRVDDEDRFINAIIEGDKDTFEQLLPCVDVNCTNLFGETPLYAAVTNAPKNRQTWFVRRLLDHHADINIKTSYGDTALIAATRPGNAVILSLLQNLNIAHLGLPNELWIEITKYLSPQELEQFKVVCQAFKNIQANADMLWQPLLNRLHAIDPRVKVTPVKGKTIRESFIAGFDQVKNDQAEEIEDFSSNNETQKYNFTFTTEHPITLEGLELQSHQLDKANCRIIQELIDAALNEHTVRIYWKGLTRFPRQILERNEAFFKKIEQFHLTGNQLRWLPDNIDICENLNEFHCCQCNLDELPASTANMQALVRLCCHNNNLSSLPKGLSKLSKLEDLIIDSNKFIAVPQVIVELDALKELSIGSNQILALPESILKILGSLEKYDFSYNPFHGEDENTENDGYDNTLYISFLESPHASAEVSESNAAFNNNPKIWLSLMEKLNTINHDSTYDPRLSLRDQFVKRFNLIGQHQLKALLAVTANDEKARAKFNIVKDDATGEYVFAYLTLDRLFYNERALRKLRSHTPYYTLQIAASDISSLADGSSEEFTDDMEIDEPASPARGLRR